LEWQAGCYASITLLRPYAARARALWRRLLFKGNLLSFGKASEIALDRRPVEEKLLTPVVADEPEPFVVHDPFNPS
jgi:hypothetical protein